MVFGAVCVHFVVVEDAAAREPVNGYGEGLAGLDYRWHMNAGGLQFDEFVGTAGTLATFVAEAAHVALPAATATTVIATGLAHAVGDTGAILFRIFDRAAEIAGDLKVAAKLIEGEAAAALVEVHGVSDTSIGQHDVSGTLALVCNFKPADTNLSDGNLANLAAVWWVFLRTEGAGFDVANFALSLALRAAPLSPPDATLTRPAVAVQVAFLDAINVGAWVAKLAIAAASSIGNADFPIPTVAIHHALYGAGQGDAVWIDAGLTFFTIAVLLALLLAQAEAATTILR